MLLRSCVVLAFILFQASPAFCQNYPAGFKQLPCPNTGQKVYPTSQEYFEQAWFKSLPPGGYVARCFYEDGEITGFWSTNISTKNDICNSEYVKGKNLGDRYNLIDNSLPRGSAFWFSYDRDPVKNSMLVVQVFEGANAYKAGLRTGNEIIAVDGLDVAKFSNDELQQFFKSHDTVTFRVNDKQKMVYRDLKISKVEHDPFYRNYQLFSPVHFAHIAYSYRNRAGKEKEDHDFWYARALEFLEEFENEAIVCLDLDMSDQGPVAN